MSVSRRWETPFAQIPEWIVRADISSHAVRLWAALDRFAGLPDGAVPSRKTLAEWLHVSTLTIDRAKGELVKIGALTILERPAQTNLYILENAPCGRGDLITGEEGDLITGEERKIVSKKIVSLSPGDSVSLRKSERAERDALWDALVEATGISPEAHAERTRFGMSVSELLRMGATPELVVARAAAFRERYPGATVTDRAICNRWGELANGAANGSKRFGRGMTSDQIKELAKRKGAK